MDSLFGLSLIHIFNALKDRNTLVLTGSNFLHNFGAMSISFFIPGFIMRTLATDPIVQTIGPALAGGLSTSLMAVLGLFLGPVFGRIIAKQHTAQWVMTFGNVWRVLIMGAFVLVLVPGVPVWVIYIPVSYTHLDVYKRQPLNHLTTLALVSSSSLT